MTKLPKSLEQKRDELASGYVDDLDPNNSLSNFDGTDLMVCYTNAFNSGALEVKAMAEKLVEALESILIEGLSDGDEQKLPPSRESMVAYEALQAWKEMWDET